MNIRPFVLTLLVVVATGLAVIAVFVAGERRSDRRHAAQTVTAADKAALDEAAHKAVAEAVKKAATVADAEATKKEAEQQKTKAAEVAKVVAEERRRDNTRKTHPFLVLFSLLPLAALFAFRGMVDTKLKEMVKGCPDTPAVAARPTAKPPTPAVSAVPGRKPLPWMSLVIYGYDAVITLLITWVIVSPLLNRCAVGLGGWYVFSRGDFPGAVYYHKALVSWAPAVWIWLTLTLGVTFASKAAQATKEHEGWGWDRAGLMTIWVLLALLCMVFISFVGATRQWGREHPKPDPKSAPVVAPAKPNVEAEDNAKKPSPQPRQGRRFDVPSRDILGG